MEARGSRFAQINSGQAFVGFMWSVLYSGIARNVWTAEGSLADAHWSLEVSQWIFTLGSAVWLVYLVHALTGWNEQVLLLDGIAIPSTPLGEFVARFERAGRRSAVVAGLVGIAVAFPYRFFPSTTSKFEAVFAGSIWLLWIVSVFLAMLRRVLSASGSETSPSGGSSPPRIPGGSHLFGLIGVMILLGGLAFTSRRRVVLANFAHYVWVGSFLSIYIFIPVFIGFLLLGVPLLRRLRSRF